MPSEAGPAGRRRLASGALVAAAGILLLLAGAPRLAAAVGSLPARSTLWDLRSGERLAPERLDAAAAGLIRSAALADSGRTRADIGYILLQKALALPPGAERARLMAEVRAATEDALARSPVLPELWARLAWLRTVEGDPAGAARALRLSLLSGQVVPAMTVSRLQLGLELHPHMDAETRNLLDQQLRLGWLTVPDNMRAMAGRADVGPLVRDALARLNPAEIDLYLARWGQLPRLD